jgi:hypothetical protein
MPVPQRMEVISRVLMANLTLAKVDGYKTWLNKNFMMTPLRVGYLFAVKPLDAIVKVGDEIAVFSGYDQSVEQDTEQVFSGYDKFVLVVITLIGTLEFIKAPNEGVLWFCNEDNDLYRIVWFEEDYEITYMPKFKEGGYRYNGYTSAGFDWFA